MGGPNVPKIALALPRGLVIKRIGAALARALAIYDAKKVLDALRTVGFVETIQAVVVVRVASFAPLFLIIVAFEEVTFLAGDRSSGITRVATREKTLAVIADSL